MHTGLPEAIENPVARSAPLSWSSAKTTMLSLSSLSAYRKRLSGVMVKKRGVLPPVCVIAPARRRPVCGSMMKPAMLS